MRVGTQAGPSLAEVPETAERAEALGYDFLTSGETSQNAFFPLVLAAEHTRRVELRTSIALAFARSPMDTAYMAWDLQRLSNGRFALGLGSQVRGHVVRRFGMEWSPPAARMREYLAALRSIWSCWQTGEKLDVSTRHYSMNLMPPAFNPGPLPEPCVKLYLAAVNPRMLQVAGELCDGVLLHSFNTPEYTEQVVLPNLEIGAAKAGRTLRDLDVSGGGFIVTGGSEEEIDANVRATKERIAFYASTRSYSPVMAAHGWQDTAERLYRMSIDGKWSSMAGEITDEMLAAFAVVGSYDDVVAKAKARYGSYATSISFDIPVRTPGDQERLRHMVRELRST